MPYQQQNLEEQRKDAADLLDVIVATSPPEVLERLQDRLKVLGLDGGSPTLIRGGIMRRGERTSSRPSANDEIAQLRQLQKACVECEPLAIGIASLGHVRLDQVKFPPFNEEIGHLVQVFNRMVEDFWEDDMRPKLRKVIYTKKDLETV
ncbi:MAG: hypothetical protein ACJAYU_001883 [Bradymonadia bacterium]|jgi:hypothetical protein